MQEMKRKGPRMSAGPSRSGCGLMRLHLPVALLQCLDCLRPGSRDGHLENIVSDFVDEVSRTDQRPLSDSPSHGRSPEGAPQIEHERIHPMSKKLKVLGLALIVVCAFGAVSASAQAAPKFTVEGVSSGSEAIAPGTTVTSTTLTLTVKNLLRITCTGLTVNGGTITVETDAGSATSLGFTGCSVDSNTGVAQPLCEVKSSGGAPNGTINTNGVTATLVTVAGSSYVTFTPTSGTSFVNIEITRSECALATTANVTGTAVAKILNPAAGAKATNVELESSQAISEAAGDKLLFGTREAWLDGKVDLHLTSDRSWGYDA
jgi:hypothetical protein